MKYILLTLACLTAAITPAAAWPFTVRPAPASVTAGEYPQITAVNFNGDSRLEWYAGGNGLITWPVGMNNSFPVIYLPSWNGATVIPITGIPADVDLDGDMDVVRINRWEGDSLARTMQVFLNNGSGQFYTGFRLDWNVSIKDHGDITQYRIVAGDFDRDGDPDLVISTHFETVHYLDIRGTVGIRWNKGVGTGIYDTATALKTNGVEARDVVVADFDRDGDEDILTALEIDAYNPDTGFNPMFTRVYQNSGTGTFTSNRFPDHGSYHSAVDLNRDGWLDFPRRVVWQNNFYIEPCLNKKDGTYDMGNGTLMQAAAFCMADLNEDGCMDVAGTREEADGNKYLIWLKGDGNGGFAPEQTIATLPGDNSSYLEIAAADHDHDGDTDLLLARKDGKIFLVENQAIHRKCQWTAGELSAGTAVTDLETADMDGDGIQDLLAVAPNLNQIRFFKGKGNGTLLAPEFKYTNSQGAAGVVAGDWNRDGRMDLAYTLPDTGLVRQALNNSSSMVLWPDSQIAAIAGADCIQRGQYGTFDGDTDLVVTSKTTGRMQWLLNNGTATSWTGVIAASTLNPPPLALAAGNMTSKAGDEVFYVTNAGGVKAWHYNNPQWAEFEHQGIAAGTHPSAAVALLDVSGNATPDIVFSSGSDTIYWWQPSLQNSPVNELKPVPGETIHALTPVDWNRDGRMDLLVAHSGGVELLVQRGGAFENAASRDVAGGCQDVVAIDLNRDGLMDAAASAAGSDKIYTFINSSRIIYTKQQGTTGTGHVMAGQTLTALDFTLEHPGNAANASQGILADPPVAVTGHTVRLFKAKIVNGYWQKGPALTAAEAQETISTVDLVTGSTQLGVALPGSVTSGGNLAINVSPFLYSSGAVSAGATRDYHIRVTLKPSAASASYQTFYIELTDKGQAKVLDLANPPLTGSFGWGVPRLVEIDPFLTDLESWRKDNFGDPAGTGNRANDADFDSDGVPNLVEYVTGTDPAVNDQDSNVTNGLTILGPESLQSQARIRLAMSTRAMNNSNIKVTIQFNTILSIWNTLTHRTGGGAWTGLTPNFVVPGEGVTTHLFHTGFKPEITKKLFFRLKVEELP